MEPAAGENRKAPQQFVAPPYDRYRIEALEGVGLEDGKSEGERREGEGELEGNELEEEARCEGQSPRKAHDLEKACQQLMSVSVDQVKLALRRVKDPDLNLNIVDLGLVYDVAVEGANVKVDMTLTSPACPSGPELMGNADKEVRAIPGVEDVQVNLVWAPFWTPEKMEPRVRAYLGF